jgi:two-component system chemotaxis sensor kinase CheA
VFVGVTVLGDGRPSLILDTAGLALRAGIVTGRNVGEKVEDEAADTTDGSGLLVAIGADGRRRAVRVADVRRLEQFSVDAVERTETVDVVQYRDVILPLVRVADVLTGRRSGAPGETPAELSETVQTVVCESSVGLIGLVVHHIEDIVPEPFALPQMPSPRGVIASLVVDDQVTELLDLEDLIADAGVKRTA